MHSATALPGDSELQGRYGQVGTEIAVQGDEGTEIAGRYVYTILPAL